MCALSDPGLPSCGRCDDAGLAGAGERAGDMLTRLARHQPATGILETLALLISLILLVPPVDVSSM